MPNQEPKTIEEIFWNYLHTVTFAHDNQPNEPHRQVIFKQDIPNLISDLEKIIEEEKRKVMKLLLEIDEVYMKSKFDYELSGTFKGDKGFHRRISQLARTR